MYVHITVLLYGLMCLRACTSAERGACAVDCILIRQAGGNCQMRKSLRRRVAADDERGRIFQTLHRYIWDGFLVGDERDGNCNLIQMDGLCSVSVRSYLYYSGLRIDANAGFQFWVRWSRSIGWWEELNRYRLRCIVKYQCELRLIDMPSGVFHVPFQTCEMHSRKLLHSHPKLRLLRIIELTCNSTQSCPRRDLCTVHITSDCRCAFLMCILSGYYSAHHQ